MMICKIFCMSYFLCDLCMKISGTTESSSLTDENYMKHILKSLKRRILKTSLDSLTSNSSCTLALTLNPWDKSILKYIKKLPDHISCDRRNATKYFKQGESRSESLTYVDNEGQLKFRNYFEKLKCYYAVPKRKHNGDREDWRLSNRKTLDQVEGLSLLKNQVNFLNVTCEEDGKQVYSQMHFYPSTAYLMGKKIREKRIRKSVRHQPSVFILIIEAMSRLNFERFMKRTQHQLRGLELSYLKGLMKMGYNTYPNLLPFMTGIRAYENESSLNDGDMGPFDDYPHLWKTFSSNGYLTSFIVDWVSFVEYNSYGRKGFKMKDPADYYTYPYWKQLGYESDCYNFYPKIEILLDMVRQFVELSQNLSVPIFHYAKFSKVTHHDFNNAQMIDKHLAEFIKENFDFIKSSIFILMGDHGPRYGRVVETTVGRMESSLPLFAISLPEELKRDFPLLTANLALNEKTITTWLDVNLMLRHIANGNFLPSRTNNPKRAFSPMHELIPKNRTCEDALIPSMCCVCDERIEVKADYSLVQKAAEDLVFHLNSIMPAKLCQPLTLKKVLSAEVVIPGSAIMDSHSKLLEKEITVNLEIVFDVRPSDARFRGQMSKNATYPRWTVIGHVDRINSYKNQSKCITNDAKMRDYCYCYVANNSRRLNFIEYVKHEKLSSAGHSK